ncbi:MAG TPA: GtrA family protein [Chloroflexota bacterium]|nr:GtrA family protein [Chloroflexota bacterium]
MLPPQAMAAGWRWSVPTIPWRSLVGEVLRVSKYGLVGLSNTVVSFLVLNLFFLLWAPTTSAALVLGSSVAYAAGDLNSYWWNKSWTFGAGESSWGQFGRFATLSLACMAINAAIVWGSSGVLLALFLPAWLLGSAPQLSMVVSGSLGYLVCRNWVFRKGQ